ncbi:MAG TPA: hypothetical protein GX745_07865, partial [Clostridiales bacterium]|nr:hypothetical protein [Clostridiales bacterium]
MQIKDSGARRRFDTGAVRDLAEGKGRCDLLPLDVIGGYTSDSILLNIDHYLREGSPRALWRAIEQYGDKKGWNIYTSMLEASKQYEDGALKYEERNWEKGIPLHCYIDSGVRH